MYSHSLRERCQIALSFFHFVFFSFYDKKKFSSKKEQKTIDASEKVSTLSLVLLVHLRTVPTKYKGFCAKLGPRGKSRSLQGLLESTKKNGGSHAFFRDN